MKKAGRNDPCPCGSGKKYKKCCADKQGLHPERITVFSPEKTAKENSLNSVFKNSVFNNVRPVSLEKTEKPIK